MRDGSSKSERPTFQERVMALMSSKSFFEFFKIAPETFANRDILNVGAGGQDLKKELEEKGINPNTVVNIDLGYNPRRISRLWRFLGKLPRKSFPGNAVQGDWDKLPFEAHSFDDAIISWSGALYVKVSDFVEMMTELMRVSRDRIFITGCDLSNIGILKTMPEISTGNFYLEELPEKTKVLFSREETPMGYILHRRRS